MLTSRRTVNIRKEILLHWLLVPRGHRRRNPYKYIAAFVIERGKMKKKKIFSPSRHILTATRRNAGFLGRWPLDWYQGMYIVHTYTANTQPDVR